MKALVFKGNAKSSLEEVEKPSIGELDILVKVKACAICGTDIKLDKGSSTKMTRRGIKNMPFPRITGHEFSGIIEKTGRRVKHFKPGDRINVSPVIPCMKCVYCKKGHEEMCENKVTIGFDIDGAFAEYIKIPAIAISAGCVHKIAGGTSFEEACFAEPLAVVLSSQMRSAIKKDDSMLILGAGPIGLLQLKLAKYHGVSRIIVADISAERLEFAKTYRPDLVINNEKENLKKAVLRETGSYGPDVIMICAPSKELFTDCLKYANRTGRINYFAGLSKTNSEINLDANLIHYNQLTLTGTSDSTPAQNSRAVDLIDKDKIKVSDLITHKFKLQDYFKALDIAKSGKAIKIVIEAT